MHGFRFLFVSVCECRRLPHSQPVTHGEVHSPRYPRPYPPNQLKQWDLRVAEGYQIQLTFTHLDIEASTNCFYSSLTVLYDHKILRKFCGGGASDMHHPGNQSILSPGNRLTLIFQTGDTNPELHRHEGFSAHYQAIDIDECSGPDDADEDEDGSGVLCSQICINTCGSYLCSCHHGYELHPDQHTCVLIDCGDPEPLLNGGITFISGSGNQYRSVVQYHCNEPFYSLPGGLNVSYTCAADKKWRDNNDLPVAPTCIPVCGRPTKLISGYQRILGGNEAPENAIPWQVMLSIDGGRAGGMVIGDHWLMTAATSLVHNGMTVAKDFVRVYMGSNNVRFLDSRMDVASFHVHPQYNNPNNLDYNNDIALIKLQHPITFNSSIMPICLSAEGDTYTTGLMGLVSGFGLEIVNGIQMIANKLKYIRLPVVDQEICRESINKVKMTKHDVPSLTDNMFCAGLPEGGRDSCQGDSGGPLAILQGGRFWAAGIISWGIDCGQPGKYGVYTKVANYRDWIIKTMQEN